MRLVTVTEYLRSVIVATLELAISLLVIAELLLIIAALLLATIKLLIAIALDDPGFGFESLPPQPPSMRAIQLKPIN